MGIERTARPVGGRRRRGARTTIGRGVGTIPDEPWLPDQGGSASLVRRGIAVRDSLARSDPAYIGGRTAAECRDLTEQIFRVRPYPFDRLVPPEKTGAGSVERRVHRDRL